jgi:lipid-A-disaccharide synthase-like uncharacterized protein
VFGGAEEEEEEEEEKKRTMLPPLFFSFSFFGGIGVLNRSCAIQSNVSFSLFGSGETVK